MRLTKKVLITLITPIILTVGEKVHLNISTAPTNFYSVTVYGCWTANYQ